MKVTRETLKRVEELAFRISQSMRARSPVENYLMAQSWIRNLGSKSMLDINQIFDYVRLVEQNAHVFGEHSFNMSPIDLFNKSWLVSLTNYYHQPKVENIVNTPVYIYKEGVNTEPSFDTSQFYIQLAGKLKECGMGIVPCDGRNDDWLVKDEACSPVLRFVECPWNICVGPGDKNRFVRKLELLESSGISYRIDKNLISDIGPAYWISVVDRNASAIAWAAQFDMYL